MQTEPIRVILADDQELVRAGLAMVINSQPDMRVVAQAADGAQAVALSETLDADVVLMDVRMPHVDGIEATRQIIAHERADHRTIHVIILTTFDLDEYVMAAIHAGASGFLLKDSDPELLLRSIRTVVDGNAIIAPSATKRLIETMMHTHFDPHANEAAGSASSAMAVASSQSANAAAEPYVDPELATLTDREREVLIEIAHGLSNQEIADHLVIGLPTVKTHVAHIFQKNSCARPRASRCVCV